jgi:hypothetical protein
MYHIYSIMCTHMHPTRRTVSCISISPVDMCMQHAACSLELGLGFGFRAQRNTKYLHLLAYQSVYTLYCLWTMDIGIECHATWHLATSACTRAEGCSGCPPPPQLLEVVLRASCSACAAHVQRDTSNVESHPRVSTCLLPQRGVALAVGCWLWRFLTAELSVQCPRRG